MAEGPPSSSTASPPGLRQYYVAVGNQDAKLATTLELLHALRAASTRPLAICCSARDSLDALVHALLASRQAFAVTAIHSDLTDKERELALASFRQAAFPAAAGSSGTGGAPDGGAAAASSGQGSRERQGTPETAVLALTDVCLKALPKELLPLGVSLLVEYDLPPSKEVYARRLSTLIGGGKNRRTTRCCVVDLVEAGQVGAFRAVESFAAGTILEMPVRAVDIFA